MTISSRGQQRDKQENAFLTNFIIAQSTVNAASTVQFLILIMYLKLYGYPKGNAKGSAKGSALPLCSFTTEKKWAAPAPDFDALLLQPIRTIGGCLRMMVLRDRKQINILEPKPQKDSYIKKCAAPAA